MSHIDHDDAEFDGLLSDLFAEIYRCAHENGAAEGTEPHSEDLIAHPQAEALQQYYQRKLLEARALPFAALVQRSADGWLHETDPDVVACASQKARYPNTFKDFTIPLYDIRGLQIGSAPIVDQVRPNVMRCAKCKLRVTGALSTALCPNGCGPLWAVTWKEECQAAEAQLDDASAAPPGMVAVPLPDPDLQEAFIRFCETTEDDGSYDIGQDAISQLAEFGLIRRHGTTPVYHQTGFGIALQSFLSGATVPPPQAARP